MNTRHQGGFTLLELMISMAILVIIATLAVPSFVQTAANSRRTATANDYFIGFQIARSEAIKRNGVVSICASSDATTCSGADNWEGGFVVFANPNTNGVVDPGEDVIRVHNGINFPNSTVRAGLSAVHFSAAGFPQDAFGAPLGAVLRVCDSDGLPEARGIELTPSGRSRVTRNPATIGGCP